MQATGDTDDVLWHRDGTKGLLGPKVKMYVSLTGKTHVL